MSTFFHVFFFYFFLFLTFLLSSLVTSPNFKSISSVVLKLWQFTFLKDWPEIQKWEYTVWVFPNIWRLEQVRDSKFGVDVSNKLLRKTAIFQGYRFYRFWVTKAKPTEGGAVKLPPSLRLELRLFLWNYAGCYINFALVFLDTIFIYCI